MSEKDKKYVDKETAVQKLHEWENRLYDSAVNLDDFNLEKLPIDFKFDNVEKDTSIITFVYGVKEVIVMGVARRAAPDLYQPLIIVTEKKKRSHGTGIGHQARYPPKQDGYPNFQRAIAQAIKRNEEIAEAVKDRKKKIKEERQIERTLSEELEGTKIPDVLTVARLNNGLYQTHMPSVSLTPAKLRVLCHLLMEEEVPQLMKA